MKKKIKKTSLFIVMTMIIFVTGLSSCSSSDSDDEYDHQDDQPTVITTQCKDEYRIPWSSTKGIPFHDYSTDGALFKLEYWIDNTLGRDKVAYAKTRYETFYVPFVYSITYDLTRTTDSSSGDVYRKTEITNIIAKRTLVPNLDDYLEEVEDGGMYTYLDYTGVSLTDPEIAGEKIVTHEDIIGDWEIIAYKDYGDDDDDQGGDSTPAGDHSGDSRYLVYAGSTTGYYKSGSSYRTEKIYIFKEQHSSSLIYASSQKGNDQGFIIKTATHKTSIGQDPWGLGCNRYYSPLGISIYFKW